MNGDVWVAGVVLLQSLAAWSYLREGDLRQFCVWGFVAASNVAYLLVHRT